ncbi:hypothetical protein CKM354_000182000 [Cercospora kikuchii]|uniref:DNA-directed RNA polymerase I subunit n=1 Tax=Cercospora kikuchii TaxID=84275 RepID=A0A9P3F918_9PEZI|nr:uncharacterized protein CKM354_000182000 [Cercospora kikuchii]GIZ38403.1 hypothetical protein CKM354_000182000 [Cercospora kikuchii]
MAQKEVKAPAKKAKTEEKVKKQGKKAATKQKAPGLSEERVVDSDSEPDETPATAKPDTKSVKAKATKQKKAPPPPTKPEPTSSSDDDESSDGSGSAESEKDEQMADAPSLKKPDTVPTRVNGVKRKAESVSSLDNGESSEDDSSSDEDKPDAKRVKTALKDAGEVEQVGEVASEEQGEDSESADEDGSAEPSAETAPTPRPTKHAGQFESIPVQSFKPPSGYTPVSVSDATFSAKSFAGQQIWHIVAPSNVSLKSLGDITLDAIQSGASILNHKGTDYSLSEDKSPNNRFDSVLVPSSSSYDSIPQPITRTLHLKQRINLPALSTKQADTNTGSSAAASVARPSVNSIRPQPKGMRMRYKPAGFGAGDAGLGSDSEEEDDEGAKAKSTSFQFPKTLGVHGAAVEVENAQTTTPKKAKKKRKDSDVDMVNGTTPVASQLPNGTSDELSKEERRRRKAEKKAKKESKAGVAVTA